MPDFPITDAHVHLYDVDRLSYGWLAGVPKIARSHGLDDFDRERGPVEVDRIVFAEVAVDPGLHLKEAAYVQEMADRDPRLCGQVAHAPLEKGAAVEADLAALAAIPTTRGIRRLIETERLVDFVLRPEFLEGLRLLPKFGFTFDICVKHWAMVYAVELARRCPEVTFVLDHIGKPDIKNGLRQPWWNQIVELAALPNVNCKISGVVTEANHAAWTPEDVKPYVARAIEVFGFERCMFGSDWTVSKLTHAYPDWVRIVDEVIAGSSREEQLQLYRGTAARVYRLPE